MKILLTFLFVSCLFFNGMADDKDNKPAEADRSMKVVITGNVADEVTGELLVGVELQLEGTDKKVYTDFDGNFFFEDVVPGEYNITASYISYEKNKIEKKTIDIFSNEVSVKLKPVN
ncbi:carboxypeptidase-like regulatory domain-containing protein [uncultured Draconibacterium sp.]|uniref:carboxypeptidase-like regulatory domain-containing protein n=1 Tax=uncultured Draconibacterium sp. TaxID=1573823 RepID=UPI003261B9B7